jgi:hypothetical protein
MALSAFRSEEQIEYPAGPASFYGFYVAGCSFSDDVHPFASEAERAAFVDAVTRGLDLGDRDAFILAALSALAVYGGDSRAEAGEETLRDAYPGEAEAALDAARRFLDRP